MSEATNMPLMENEHVKELLTVMQDNRMDAKSLVVMLGYVAAVERQLDKATGELAAMRQELSSMREERNHPLRMALSRAIHTLENSIAAARARLDTIKAAIITGCKSAVESFKRTGISALNNLARFFRLKPLFQSLSGDLDHLIKQNDNSIAKIEAVSAEYHATGLHLKNIARVLAGKEPIAEINPNGRLAALLKAPFELTRDMRASVKENIDRATDALGRLEQAAPVRERKPSVREEIQRFKAVAEQAAREAPALTRTPRQGEAML